MRYIQWKLNQSHIKLISPVILPSLFGEVVIFWKELLGLEVFECLQFSFRGQKKHELFKEFVSFNNLVRRIPLTLFTSDSSVPLQVYNMHTQKPLPFQISYKQKVFVE